MLSLLFFVAVRPQDDPASRFEKLMQSASSIKVEMGLQVTGVPHVGKGFFQAKKPSHVLWVMKWGPSDFSFSSVGDEVVAIERGSKLYREYGAVGRLFVPESDISSTPEYGFPLPLLAGTLKSLVPEGIKFQAAGKSNFEGEPVDKVRAQFTTPAARITVEAMIDAKGRLLRCTTEYGGGRSPHTQTLTFRNYALNLPLAAASFRTEIPKGFSAQTLPPDSYSLNVGEKFPLERWSPLDGSSDLKTVAQNKVLFIAIGDPDCEVSVRAARTVATLADQVTKKGGAAAALCATSQSPRSAFKSIPNFYDPTGKVFAQLRTPGTPMFFLVSPKGIITRVWYGFDNGQAGEFAKDVLEWVDPDKGN